MARKSTTRKLARIKYNHRLDTYEIETNTGNGWDLETAYLLHPSAKTPEKGRAFIHYSFIIKLQDLQNMGYEIDFTSI